MKILIYTILFVLIASCIFATTTTITTLPYTASQNGTNYSDTLILDGTKLSSNSNGIRVTGDNIVINLGTDTLIYGVTTGSSYGIRFEGNSIKVLGGYILHQPSDSTLAWNNTFLYYTNDLYSIYIDSVHANIDGYNGQVIESEYGSGDRYNNEIAYCTFWSDVTSYNSRCACDGCLSRFTDTSKILTGEQYHLSFHDNTILYTPQQGIIVSGKCYVYNNNITCDSRNDRYCYATGNILSTLDTTGDSIWVKYTNSSLNECLLGEDSTVWITSQVGYNGNKTIKHVNDTSFIIAAVWVKDTIGTWNLNGTCDGSTQTVGIHGYNLHAGSYIQNNTITAGDNWYGMDEGILIENCNGSSTNWIDISGNDVTVHRGKEENYGWLNGKCFKNRYANQYVKIHHNSFLSLTGDTVSSGAYGPIGLGADMIFDWDDGADALMHRWVDSSIWFYNNVVEVRALNDEIRASGIGNSGNIGIRMAITHGNGFSSSYAYGGTPDSMGLIYSINRDLSSSTRIIWRSTTPQYGPSPFLINSRQITVGTEYFYKNVSWTGLTPDSSALDSVTKDSPYNFTDAGNKFYNNKIISAERAYSMAGFDANGYCNTFSVVGDSVYLADSGWTHIGIKTFFLGYGVNAIDNVFQDLYYGDNTADSNIFFQGGDGEKEIFIKKTCTVTVVGNNALPVASANYWVWNNYDDTVMLGTTDINGRGIDTLTNWYEAEDAADSTGYNPFTIKVKYESDSSMGDSTVIWNDGSFVMTLSNTEGSEEEPPVSLNKRLPFFR